MKAFKELGYELQSAHIVWLPHRENKKRVERHSEQAKALLRVTDELEAEDTVTGIYTTVIIGD